MKFRLFTYSFFLTGLIWAQGPGEVLSPLMINPHLKPAAVKHKSGSTIDSTFIYEIDTINVPLFDDFSTDRFIKYNAAPTDGNVTSQLYYRLMNSTNTVSLSPSVIFCDSSHAHHDTVSVVAGIPTITTDYFTTPNSVWVNDLNSYPVQGQLRTLYQECYVLIDSIIDGIPDPDQDTVFFTAVPDFVQDSASVFTVDYTDPSTIWVDNSAYHNYRYAVDPWSLGVVTFDGVDENGLPYHFGNTSAHFPADVLTSRPINLAGKTNVYLTFLYQAEGYGDAPEANDSLLLDWWLPDSNAWYPSQWYAVGGGATDVWDTVHWAVPFTALDNGFRFRFRNWASTSGALDHWHIDYVTLKDNDFPTVSNFSDLAISEPINSLLDTYTAVPWDHFKNASASANMLDTLKVRVYNSDITPTNYANGGLEIRYNGILQGGSPYVLNNPAITSEWTGNWELAMNKYPYPLASNYTFNNSLPAAQAAFEVKLYIDAAVSVSNAHPENDTTYFVQDFRNYYAYDDGSAEAAYGITGTHSLLAYKFTAYEEDSLTGVLIHWVPSVYNHSDKEILITIWEDNGGVPGDIIYQDDYFNTNHPEYSGSINGFKYFTFMGDQKIAVPQTFYIGWEQIESVSLNVGMDMNIPNSNKIFRNVSGSWQTSAIPGSLMIRPVFSTGLNYTLSTNEVTQEPGQEVLIYPNPALNEINVQTNLSEFSVQVYDLTGRLIINSFNERSVDLNDLNSGMYLVLVYSGSEVVHTEKLIKQ